MEYEDVRASLGKFCNTPPVVESKSLEHGYS